MNEKFKKDIVRLEKHMDDTLRSYQRSNISKATKDKLVVMSEVLKKFIKVIGKE